MYVPYRILLCMLTISKSWSSAVNRYWKTFPYTGPVTLNYYSLILNSSLIPCTVNCWTLYNWDQIYFQGEDCYCLAPVYENRTQVSGTVTTNREFWTIHQDVSSCLLKNYTIFAAQKYCLKYFSFDVTYANAEGQCREDGGHLVSVHTTQDVTNFRSLYIHDKTIHIGAHRTLDGANFGWITGGYVNDTVWGHNEPNNSDDEEDCVSVNGNGKFNDVHNRRIYAFICQILTE